MDPANGVRQSMFKVVKHGSYSTEWVSQAEEHNKLGPVIFQMLLVMMCCRNANRSGILIRVRMAIV
jgi:hypothetical protein